MADSKEFSPSGEYLTQFGSGSIAEPSGVAALGGGIVYVAHGQFINRVEKWK